MEFWAVKGDVYGREPREKTSPDTRMGTRSPYLSVRISRASRLMGVLEGVDRVRGWMVRKSICRSWEDPRTVSIKSIVFLFLFWPPPPYGREYKSACIHIIPVSKAFAQKW